MKQRRNKAKPTLALLTLAVLIGFALPIRAAAATQGFYTIDGQPQSGMLMSLTANSGVVEQANTNSAASLVGVAAPNEASLDLQPGQVSVATDGPADALVSTLGGNIKAGDRITTSSITGVGAKESDSGWIVGVAQNNFNASTSGAVATTLADSHGHQHQVYVGHIGLLVKITYYAAQKPAPKGPSWIPSAVQSIANSLAGRPVPAWALVVCLVILFMGVLLAGMIINSAVRGGIAGIARQPLSKNAIIRKVMQSFLMALLLLAAVVGGVALLLRVLAVF